MSTHCKQCGTCCRKGGPPLRREDIELVRQGRITHEQLVTIRHGELGLNPASGRLEPVPVELVKVRGSGGDWTCLFLDRQNNTCAIYQHRPMGCKILECWRPEAALGQLYENTLGRCDLINKNDPILAEIERHEEACPGREFSSLCTGASQAGADAAGLIRLTELVRTDLAIRAEVARAVNLPVSLEFFLFGRPLFTQLAGCGLDYSERDGTVRPRQRG